LNDRHRQYLRLMQKELKDRVVPDMIASCKARTSAKI